MGRMVMGIFAASLIGSLASAEDVFRVSRVVGEDSKNADRMSLVRDGHEEEKLFVSREAIVTEKDVEDAWPQPVGPGVQLSIKLKPKGGERMERATGKLSLGVDRMAIIIDGDVVIAPVVQAVLSDSFVVHLGDASFETASDMARRILGRPPVEPSDAPVPRLPETRPYTEEEYQTLKKQREKMGLHYLDALPAEACLDELVARQASKAEIIERFGPPTYRFDESDTLTYRLAPEKLPENPDGKARPAAIEIRLKDGKASSWMRNWWTDEPPARRLADPPRRLLKATLPQFDLSTDEPDMITPIENIRIPDLHQEVTLADLFDVLAMVWMPIQQQLHDDSKQDMKADCDVLKFLALHFPEMAKLRERSKEGRISLEALEECLEPYLTGNKDVPDPEAKKAGG